MPDTWFSYLEPTFVSHFIQSAVSQLLVSYAAGCGNQEHKSFSSAEWMTSGSWFKFHCSLNWQHQLCKNPRPNPDIKTLFVDHSCGQPNGARAPSPGNNHQLLGSLPKAGGFPSLGAHGVGICTNLIILLVCFVTLLVWFSSSTWLSCSAVSTYTSSCSSTPCRLDDESLTC